MLGQDLFAFVNTAAAIAQQLQQISQLFKTFLDSNRIEDARKLIDANIQFKDNFLVIAAQSGKLEIARYLIEEKQANIEAKDANNDNSLMWAAFNGHTHVVKFLLDKGANKEPRNNNSNTPIIEASAMGQSEAVGFLLSKGADINARNKLGNNALSLAAENGHIHVATLLLNEGIDTTNITISKEKVTPGFLQSYNAAIRSNLIYDRKFSENHIITPYSINIERFKNVCKKQGIPSTLESYISQHGQLSDEVKQKLQGCIREIQNEKELASTKEQVQKLTTELKQKDIELADLKKEFEALKESINKPTLEAQNANANKKLQRSNSWTDIVGKSSERELI